jgi:GDP-L-fucose synthase
MEKESKIYVAGHTGLVGSAILSSLKEKGYTNIITKEHDDTEFDLTTEEYVYDFFHDEKPEYVFLAAAKVGGIYSNSTFPADFIYENLAIQTNVIRACWYYHVKKLLFLGSSCIYPRNCKQPMKETDLLTGELESTNEAYAIAKIAGIKMCQAYNKQYGTNFISAMPTNLYGPNDNFDVENGHVIGSLIAKFATAKKENKPVEILGNGTAMREFLYSEDCADALIFLMNNYESSDIINVGCNEYLSIKDLVEILSILFEYDNIVWDTSFPNGTLYKKLDTTKLEKLGWKYKTSLVEGLEKAIGWYYETRTV